MEKEQIYKLVEFCNNVELLDTLLEDQDINNNYIYLKYNIAKNQKASPKMLTKLFEENDDSILLQMALGKNPNSPNEILEKLIKSNDWKIRQAAASNKNIDPKLLEVLSEDDDSDVLISVGKNPNSPRSVLNKLSYHENDFVSNAAKSNPKILKNIAKRNKMDRRRLNNDLSNIPLIDLISLAKDKNDDIRLALSNNATTPSLILSILALDDVKDISNNAISNPNYISLGIDDFEW